jgi:hypothetical protein
MVANAPAAASRAAEVRLRTAVVKLAETGSADEASFEQAFSSIAHAYLRNRAPSLLDHELGFQLLDASEDKKKAIGIMAFKVGSQTLYAPVFFLNGELKGHELLYIVEQDMFIPLQENWLNYLIQRKPHMLGTGATRNLHSKGVRQPDLNRLSMSPTKYAACVQAFLPVFGHLATRSIKEAVAEFAEHCNTRLSLEHFLQQAPLPMLKAAATAIRDDIEVAAAFEEFHGLELLRTALKTAASRMETTSVLDVQQMVADSNKRDAAYTQLSILSKLAADGDSGPEHKNDLKIITRDTVQPGEVDLLTEEEQAELLNDDILIQDHRSGDEVSVAVNVTGKQTLSNPHETGIYQVLTKPHGFQKCLVVMGPCGVNGRETFCVVVSLEGSKAWANLARKDVWVAGFDEAEPGKVMEGTDTAWDKWLDTLPEATSLSASKSRYMIVGPRRNGTVPFRVVKELSTSGGMPRYDIDANDFCAKADQTSFDYNPDRYDKWRDGQRITLKAKNGTDLRSSAGELYVPIGAKLLSLEPAEGDKEDTAEDGCCMPVSSSSFGQSDPAPLVPGNHADIEMILMRKTAGLEVRCRPRGYSVNESPTLLSRNNTLLHLVVDWQLPVKQAKFIIKEADARRRAGAKPYSCRVKFALSSLLESAPTAPSMDMDNQSGSNIMGFPGPVQELRQQSAPIEGMQPSDYDQSGYDIRPDATPSPMDLKTVQDAAATGQKEVFDVSMIGSMLKSVRDDTMIDRYLSDLLKALDRLGRIIFMFYWHQQKFATRYGKQDMPELEDGLRSTFESLGEIVLLLRQKSVETYPEEGGQIFNPNPENSGI